MLFFWERATLVIDGEEVKILKLVVLFPATFSTDWVNKKLVNYLRHLDESFYTYIRQIFTSAVKQIIKLPFGLYWLCLRETLNFEIKDIQTKIK